MIDPYVRDVLGGLRTAQRKDERERSYPLGMGATEDAAMRRFASRGATNPPPDHPRPVASRRAGPTEQSSRQVRLQPAALDPLPQLRRGSQPAVGGEPARRERGGERSRPPQEAVGQQAAAH